MKWAGFSIFLVLGACNYDTRQSHNEPLRPSTSPIELTASELAKVQNAVRMALSEPSPEFRGITAVRLDDTQNIVCGYAGQKPFIASYDPQLLTASVTAIGGSETHAAAVRSRCERYGLVI